jgi:hypothetical protein
MCVSQITTVYINYQTLKTFKLFGKRIYWKKTFFSCNALQNIRMFFAFFLSKNLKKKRFSDQFFVVPEAVGVLYDIINYF